MRFLVSFWLAVASVGIASAQQSQRNDHIAEPLPRVDAALEPFVGSEIAGAVTYVFTDGHAHINTLGQMDIESKRPMSADAIFWIASMSKPVTGVCVMKMVEAGKLDLDAPISDYLPQMKQLRFQGEPVTITTRQLMNHTSGMAELPPDETYRSKDLAEAADRYAQVEILFKPGTEWRYSQTSINTAARIVEVLSGQNFAEFVQEQICEPLGMRDTAFYLSEKQASRLATSYRREDDGGLTPTTIRILYDRPPTYRDRMPAANGGLFSTAADYGRFCRMLLGGGELDGVRVLSEESVKEMTRVSTGKLQVGFTPGNGWGVGVCVVREPQGITSMLSPGSFGHGGAYGTQAWIDPQEKSVYVMMVQRANFNNSDASPVRQAFQAAAAE